MKEIINCQRERIIANPSTFLIPYVIEDKNIINDPNIKTNIRIICLNNCHIHCKDLIKNCCKAFYLKFNCKVCPNRCPASYHIFVKYELPKHDYKTIDQIFPNEENKVEEKINYAFSYIQKENKELSEKIDYIKNELTDLKNEIDGFYIDMKKINDELNEEIKKFLSKFVWDFGVKETYEAEIFKVFLYTFLKMDYVYEFIE